MTDRDRHRPVLYFVGHPDHLLVHRIITSLEYCNVDVSVINQARASSAYMGWCVILRTQLS